ncbi:hypothetical protein [Vibrio sp. HN007]|uniref:hypothetical protein n=1 Tax=Vibrio iocasae TaxID=3098914 RepID=UPI0035D4DBA5
MHNRNNALRILVLSIISCGSAYAAEESELQDMSDPLAVYTQAGFGVSDKGINLKVGQTYDTGNPVTMGMNVIEIKGIGGKAIGIRSESDFPAVDDSVDSFRFRNFGVDLTNGRGHQLDLSYSVEQDRTTASYSFIQALPKFGPVSLYPLAGLGLDVMNSKNYPGEQASDSGYTIPGTFALVGMYSKVEITKNIWINYNPMYMSTLSGADWYKKEIYAGESSILTHEFALSYQINKRSNLRYFANWNEKTDFADGDHRIEYNYQF